ncbi:MAG: sirohydrochlorin cobaltochelatase [Thermodesulfobacteriota bacterium]
MRRNRLIHGMLIVLLALIIPFTAAARPGEEKAIVLAVFGTSHIEALPGILTIRDRVQQAFPQTRVELAFTSNIIRRIWQQRSQDRAYRAAHPEVPRDILEVKGPLAAVANLQDAGYGHIIVQPTHIAAGEEFADLSSYVDGFNSIRTVKARNMPLKRVIIGRPALGAPGIEHEYRRDLEIAARALAEDVKAAAREKRALVYMAHGNEHYSTGYYVELEAVMREMYPATPVYIGMVEGFPGLDRVMAALARDGVRQVYLKPLMTVAGDHAKNDMAGDEPDSWRKVLEANGMNVQVDLRGLGESVPFAEIFVQHIRDAAKGHGLELK